MRFVLPIVLLTQGIVFGGALPTVDLSGDTNRQVVVARGAEAVYQGASDDRVVGGWKDDVLCVDGRSRGHVRDDETQR